MAVGRAGAAGASAGVSIGALGAEPLRATLSHGASSPNVGERMAPYYALSS
jgi:hypothetical protein